jgi:hypothetical protein
MITFVLIAMVGLLAIAVVVLVWVKGSRASNGKSGVDNRAASDEPKVGRATGLD